MSRSRACVVADAMYVLHQGVWIPPYEILLAKQYQKFLKPGDTAFDIGAHSGFHAAFLLPLVGRSGAVVAFEPVARYARWMSWRFYKWPSLTIRKVALSSRPGVQKFNFVKGYPQYSGFQLRDGMSKVSVFDVAVETLDMYADRFPRVDYIKIDIEGAEIDCLLGARDAFFRRHKPIISVEYGEPSYSKFGHRKETLFNLANDLGYMMSDLFGNLITTAEDWNYVCDRSMWDYFMVPKERAAGWEQMMS